MGPEYIVIQIGLATSRKLIYKDCVTNSMILVYTAFSRRVVGKKVHPPIPKGIVGSFEFAVLQRNLKEWHERPLKCVCEF